VSSLNGGGVFTLLPRPPPVERGVKISQEAGLFNWLIISYNQSVGLKDSFCRLAITCISIVEE